MTTPNIYSNIQKHLFEIVGILVGRRSIRRMFEFVLVSWFIF